LATAFPLPCRDTVAIPFRERIVVAIFPPYTMTFLSVRAAAELVGKSSSSIRRLIYPIIKNDDHADRHLVQPSVEEAKRLRLAGVNFAWQVSEELLKRIPSSESETQHAPTAGASRTSHGSENELIAMLQRELDIKNKQIAQQNDLIAKHAELIGGLSQRLGEGNVLIASLQQRLALSDGREDRSSSTVEATTTDESKASAKVDEAVATKKPGFFARLFQSEA
jgi:hypothetical protein